MTGQFAATAAAPRQSSCAPRGRLRGRSVSEATVEWFFDGRSADAADGTPRRTWVYRQVLDAIRAGTLAPGARLPSARRLAAAWRVPRGAVDDAFAQLQSEGLVERRVGHGSIVAHRLHQGARVAHAGPAVAVDASTRKAVARLLSLAEEARVSTPASDASLRLRPGMPDTASFPLPLWRRELARALGDDRRSVLGYGVPSGLAALREATAKHLSLTRSIRCQPEQVLILGSPRQAIELMARVLLAPGEAVCVEDPSPLAVTRRLSLPHLQVVAVPPDDDGFDVAWARRHAPQAAAVVMQPLHQWPTGVRTSAARRRELLDWSDQGGAWIVELDSLGEIVHDGAAPAALQCSDRSGRLIFVGSFGALTFPALRIAYVVLPESLIDVFAAMRGLMGEHVPVAMQSALAGFIDGGHLSTHVRAVRRLYRERRDALVQAVQRHLPDGARLGPVTGGIHASLHLDQRWPDVNLAERLSERHLAVQALSRHAWQRQGLNGLLLGYGADDVESIDSAVAEIGALLCTS